MPTNDYKLISEKIKALSTTSCYEKAGLTYCTCNKDNYGTGFPTLHLLLDQYLPFRFMPQYYLIYDSTENSCLLTFAPSSSPNEWILGAPFLR